MALLTGARCSKHAEAGAVETCSRCGRFVCGDCLQLHGEVAFCEDCYDKVIRPPESGKSLWAAGLAGASTVLGFYGLMVAVLASSKLGLGTPICVLTGFGPGLLGLSMAYTERRRIESGEASMKGKIYADAAVYMGWFCVVFLGISLLIVVGVMVKQAADPGFIDLD